MRHVAIHNKRNELILVHVEDLVEAYPANERGCSVCVIRVDDRGKENTFLVVKESTEEIHAQLKELKYEVCRDRMMDHGARKRD